MSDDLLCPFFSLVLVYKFFRSRKRDLVDVFVDFLVGHTNPVIADGKRFCLAVQKDFHFQVAKVSFIFTVSSQNLKFLGSVNRIGNQFSKENFVIGIKEFFNNGKNVLRLNVDLTCSHVIPIFSCIPLRSSCRKTL